MGRPFDIPEGKTCENCGERPATELWLGDGGGLALSHGFYKYWCERCVLMAQLEHARKRAEEIPRLEARLALLDS